MNTLAQPLEENVYKAILYTHCTQYSNCLYWMLQLDLVLQIDKSLGDCAMYKEAFFATSFKRFPSMHEAKQLYIALGLMHLHFKPQKGIFL